MTRARWVGWAMWLAVLVAVVGVLPGCADQLAVSYRSITATRTLCTQYLDRARISAAAGQNCLNETARARQILDAVAAGQSGKGAPAPKDWAAQIDAALAAAEAAFPKETK
jgi:hypothetical protein